MDRHTGDEGLDILGYARVRAWLRLSAAERLDWLEQAKRFCSMAAGAAARLEQMRRARAKSAQRS